MAEMFSRLSRRSHPGLLQVRHDHSPLESAAAAASYEESAATEGPLLLRSTRGPRPRVSTRKIHGVSIVYVREQCQKKKQTRTLMRLGGVCWLLSPYLKSGLYPPSSAPSPFLKAGGMPARTFPGPPVVFLPSRAFWNMTVKPSDVAGFFTSHSPNLGSGRPCPLSCNATQRHACIWIDRSSTRQTGEEMEANEAARQGIRERRIPASPWPSPRGSLALR